MERIRNLAILFLICSVVTLHGEEAKTIAKTEIPSKPGAPAALPQTVALDDEFTELYGDYALLVQEIERIDNATGTITIQQSMKALRTRAQAKEKKMQAWIDAHHVPPGATLDMQGRRFIAKAVPPAAKPETAPVKP